MPLRRRDGHTVLVEATTTVVARGPELLGFLCIIQDVTAIHRTRGQLGRALAWQQAIFEGSRDAVLITDAQLRFVAVNLAAVKLSGYTRDELLHMSVFDLCREQDLTVARRVHDRVMTGEEVITEVPTRRKDRTVVDTEMSIRCITVGGKTYVHATARDITDRKRAQKALRENEQKYRGLFENAREAFILVDTEGRIASVNRFVEEYGFHKKDLIGRKLFDFIAPDDLARAIADFRTLLGDKPVRGEMDVVTPKGVMSVEYRDNPIRRGDQIVGVQIILTDITGHKRAEQLLRQERDRAQTYLHLAGVVTVATDSRQRVTLINTKGCEVLEHSEEEVLGKCWSDHFVPARARERARAVFEGLMAGETGQYEYVEGPILTKTGRERLVNWHNTVLRNEAGTVIGTLSSGEDITDRRRAEKAALRGEQFLRATLTACPVGIALMRDRVIRWCNKAVEDLTGYPAGFLRGKPVSVLCPSGDEYERVSRVISDGLNRTGTGEVESSVVRRDGTMFDSHLQVSFLDPLDSSKGCVGALTDITERRKLKREIVVREKYLDSLFTGATAGLALLDKNLRYIQINNTLAEMHGVPAQDHLGRTVREVVPHLAPMIEPYLGEVLAAGEAVLDVEVTAAMPNEPDIQRHWRESFFPIMGTDGVVEAVGTIVVEITEHKRTEQQLLEHQNRLRALAAELTFTEERERRRIAVGVHEQIAQRLALAKLSLHSLGASSGEANISTTTEVICKEIDKVIEDAHSLTFELSNPILYEVGFEAAVESWLARQVGDRHGIEYTFKADPHPPDLDRELRVALFQVVRELLTNVIKHAKAKHVDVSVEKTAETMQITVSRLVSRMNGIEMPSTPSR